MHAADVPPAGSAEQRGDAASEPDDDVCRCTLRDLAMVGKGVAARLKHELLDGDDLLGETQACKDLEEILFHFVELYGPFGEGEFERRTEQVELYVIDSSAVPSAFDLQQFRGDEPCGGIVAEFGGHVLFGCGEESVSARVHQVPQLLREIDVGHVEKSFDKLLIR